jgi:hypothetical protein
MMHLGSPRALYYLLHPLYSHQSFFHFTLFCYHLIHLRPVNDEAIFIVTKALLRRRFSVAYVVRRLDKSRRLPCLEIQCKVSTLAARHCLGA